MDILSSFIINNPALAILICGLGYCIYKRFVANVAVDGFQISDVSKSITEGEADYKKALAEIEYKIAESKQVIEDITINDTDTVAAVKTTLEGAQGVITALKTFK